MKKLTAVLMVVLVTSGAMAGEKFLQLSLTPDVALFDRSEQIEGLTIGFWFGQPHSPELMVYRISQRVGARDAHCQLALLAADCTKLMP